METIKLYDFQIDFIKELLQEYSKSKSADRDTRLLAKDILCEIEKQSPTKIYDISLKTGELIVINA